MILTNSPSKYINKHSMKIWKVNTSPVSFCMKNDYPTCATIVPNGSILSYTDNDIDDIVGVVETMKSIVLIMSEEIDVTTYDLSQGTFQVGTVCSKYSDYIKINYNTNKYFYIQPEKCVYENGVNTLKIPSVIDLSDSGITVNSVKYVSGCCLYKEMLEYNKNVFYKETTGQIDIDIAGLNLQPKSAIYYTNNAYKRKFCMNSYGCPLSESNVYFEYEKVDNTIVFNNNFIYNDFKIPQPLIIKQGSECYSGDTIYRKELLSPPTAKIIFTDGNKYTYIDDNPKPCLLYINEFSLRDDYYSAYDIEYLYKYFSLEDIVDSYSYTINTEQTKKQDLSSSNPMVEINKTASISMNIRNTLDSSAFINDDYFKLIIRKEEDDV